jgi:hypothetical protein
LTQLSETTRALIGEEYVKAMYLGTASTAPLLKAPIGQIPLVGTVDRSLFSTLEQRLGSDLTTLRPLTNELISDPDDSRWGWFSGGWSRPDSADTPRDARTQESVVDLAWFYTQQRDWNPYYQNPVLFDQLLAALRYYISLQLPNGGLTENSEFGELAPTTFALDRLGWTYILLSNATIDNPDWNDYCKLRLEEMLVKLATWYLDETNDVVWVGGLNYSNQVIAGLVGCLHIKDFLPLALQIKLTQAIDRVVTNCVSDAGYLYEGYGVDFGYTAEVALPDLSYIYEKTNNTGIAQIFRDDVDFMSYNYLLEPDGRGFTVNGAICARQPLVVYVNSRRDLDGRLDVSGTIRTVTPVLNAFLTSAEEKAAFRTSWANATTNPPTFARGDFRSYRIHASSRPENLPTQTEKNAAIAALPYIAQTAFTVARHDTKAGSSLYNRHYVYVKRPSYYAGVYYGNRSGSIRCGVNFLYHPDMGAIISTQPNNQTIWGMRKPDGYNDHVATHSTNSTIPTDATNFTLQLNAANNASQRSVAFNAGSLVITPSTTGDFIERIPLIVWPTATGQVGDVLTVTYADTTTEALTDAVFTGSITKISLTRADRGTATFTFDQARTVTVDTATSDTYTLFSGTYRKTRYVDISASDTFTYSVTISSL